MNRIAEAYVKLVLAVGRHDPDYVDAYYGPEAWKKEAEERAAPLAEIKDAAVALAGRLAALPEAQDEMEDLRRRVPRADARGARGARRHSFGRAVLLR